MATRHAKPVDPAERFERIDDAELIVPVVLFLGLVFGAVLAPLVAPLLVGLTFVSDLFPAHVWALIGVWLGVLLVLAAAVVVVRHLFIPSRVRTSR